MRVGLCFFVYHPGKTENYLIYADRCALSENDLLRFGITFKKIPRDIARV